MNRLLVTGIISFVTILKACGGASSGNNPSEETPTGDPVTLTDFEGDSAVEYVVFNNRHDDILSDPAEHKLYDEKVMVFTFAMAKEGELGIYDLTVDEQRIIEVTLNHSDAFDVIEDGFNFISSDPINYGRVSDPQGELSGFLEWQFEDGILTLKTHPGTSIAHFRRNRTELFDNPLEWQIQTIEGSTDKQAIFNLQPLSGQKVKYIAQFNRLNNSLIDISPMPETELNRVFYMDLHSNGRIWAHLLNPGSTKNGINAYAGGYLVGGAEPTDYTMIYRSQTALDQLNESELTYEFYEGAFLLQLNSNETLVTVAYDYNEEDQVYRTNTRTLGRLIDEEKQRAVEDVKRWFRELVVKRSPSNKDDFLTFSENIALSVLNSGVYLPNSGQAQNNDVDSDGIINSEDGDPLDPEEILDSDLDGIGDNGDECINQPGEADFNGCPEPTPTAAPIYQEVYIMELEDEPSLKLLSNNNEECCEIEHPRIDEITPDERALIGAYGEDEGFEITVPQAAAGTNVVGLDVYKGPESPSDESGVYIFIDGIEVGIIPIRRNSTDWLSYTSGIENTAFFKLDSTLEAGQLIKFINTEELSSGNFDALGFYVEE